MFDRVGSFAERVATNVSRRAFLGQLGQGALGLAAVIGGVLAFPAVARADNNSCWFCSSLNGYNYYACAPQPPNVYCSFVHKGCGKPCSMKTPTTTSG